MSKIWRTCTYVNNYKTTKGYIGGFVDSDYIDDYYNNPAFLSTVYAPSLLIFLMARVESIRRFVIPSSGTKTRFFCKFTLRPRLPVGLNSVARVRLLYPPPMRVFFCVIGHVLDI